MHSRLDARKVSSVLVALSLAFVALRCGSSELDDDRKGDDTRGGAGAAGAAGAAGTLQSAGSPAAAGASETPGCRLGGADVEPTFEGVKAIFQTSCVGCHNGSMSNLVDLRDNVALPDRLRTPLSRGACAGRTLVAEEAADSLLPAKLRPSPPCGARMPSLCMNTSCLSEACVDVVATWVDAGAPM